jgi:hypothetical protein
MPAVQTPRLPPDLILTVFEHANDLSTLNGLIGAYPTLLGPMLEPHFDTLVFGASWPEELRQYVYTILLAETRTPTSVQELKVLMADQLEGSGPRLFPPALPRNHRTLKRLASLTDTINFFVRLCVATYLMHFPPEKQMPPSPGEELRIRRALLRFQLYTQLFHQPEATDEIASDRDWEQRHLMEQHFWTRFESVEWEECKCIYSLLYYSLTHLRPIIPSTSETSTSQSPPFKSKRRGLPLLKLVFSGAPLSPLASSYAQRFIEYAFTGLEKVDPHHGNYFLPFHDFQNHKERWDRAKRYRPSEAHREANFGVWIGIMPKKYHPVVKDANRTALRLIGYCFWDEGRTDWRPEVFGISLSKMNISPIDLYSTGAAS